VSTTGTPDPGAPPATPAELVRSREVLRTGTRWTTTERITVRRRIVTETRQVAVTVRREELEITREPLTPEPAAAVDHPGQRSPLVVVLHEEVPVVRTEVRPYEEVTLTVEVLAGEQEVTAVLREEQIAAETRGAVLPASADTHEPV